ncbi:hypothetical protein PR048_005285 [Dryococelus australis]|uniref:Uncharacterized protein n=1 Tax=Dryococelus australis TaxID=614101 RepID=A0ABQ9I8T9_9NEOP|nr:hypothetical protein PR048_005285 [Dryococelus australis]
MQSLETTAIKIRNKYTYIRIAVAYKRQKFKSNHVNQNTYIICAPDSPIHYPNNGNRPDIVAIAVICIPNPCIESEVLEELESEKIASNEKYTSTNNRPSRYKRVYYVKSQVKEVILNLEINQWSNATVEYTRHLNKMWRLTADVRGKKSILKMETQNVIVHSREVKA